ncbi:MAG: IS1380 family transposase [Spirochaetota bacterium]
MVTSKPDSVKTQIDTCETTSEKLTGRAGLALVSRYLAAAGATALLAQQLSFLRKSRKGLALESIFHQILCFFVDGTDLHLTRFDRLRDDPGYAGTIETAEDRMVSSHAVKRFFRSITIVRVWLFRRVLRNMFLWRLRIEKPEVIWLGIDTMVMDNDDAHQREGVTPTYKKVKGFQPLQVFWNRMIVDAIFREGKAHSNHGNHVVRVITELVRLVRGHYDENVPIGVVADTGFYDQDLFALCDRLNIAFIVGGKIYKDIAEYIAKVPYQQFQEYQKDRNTWEYCEFGDRRGSWKRFRRAIYTKPVTDEQGQGIFEFARPETIIYTNLGPNRIVTTAFSDVLGSDEAAIGPELVINTYHLRARDELVNRAFKEFGSEHVPFKRFASNAAYYYLMVIAFFLFETFKQDMDSPVIPVTWYPTTFRRRCLDIAGKIVKTAGRTVLKITATAQDNLQFLELWKRSVAIPPIGSCLG